MPSGLSPLVSILPGGLAAAGCLAGAMICLRKKRIIDDLPTSKTQGVFIGLTELKGSAESDVTLTSHLSEKLCVQYTWQVEEHWSRTVTETYRDSKGNTHTRTRTESGWKKVDGGSEAIPFYLKDDTGILRIQPHGANIQGASTFNVTCGRENSLYFAKGPSGEIANSTHKRRFSETAISLHSQLYIIGQAREREDMVAAEIAADKKAPIFTISMQTEKQISRGYFLWFMLWLVLGIAIVSGSAAGLLILAGTSSEMTWQPFVIMIGGYLVVFVIAWLWTTYNNLIDLHHQVERAWSQIEIQFKLRNDLVLNLVRVIEGFKQYEGEIQPILAEMRTQASTSNPAPGKNQLKGLAPALQIVAERYPEIKAAESFLKLQQSLVDTEQRIALARDYYNDVTTFFYTRLAVIPQRYVAVLARLHPGQLLAATDFERAPVKITLVS